MRARTRIERQKCPLRIVDRFAQRAFAFESDPPDEGADRAERAIDRRALFRVEAVDSRLMHAVDGSQGRSRDAGATVQIEVERIAYLRRNVRDDLGRRESRQLGKRIFERMLA